MATIQLPKNPLLKGVRQNFRRFLRSLAGSAGTAGEDGRRGQRLMAELRRQGRVSARERYPVAQPALIPDAPDARRRMKDCMKRLPAEQQAVLVMVCVQGRSYEESAGMLHIPVAALRTRLSDARQKLQELEGAWGNGAFTMPAARFLGANEGF